MQRCAGTREDIVQCEIQHIRDYVTLLIRRLVYHTPLETVVNISRSIYIRSKSIGIVALSLGIVRLEGDRGEDIRVTVPRSELHDLHADILAVGCLTYQFDGLVYTAQRINYKLTGGRRIDCSDDIYLIKGETVCAGYT